VSDPVPGGYAPAYPTDQPPAAAPKQGNGLAVAALIFGIIGASILGLIFGILGLRKAKQTGTGKGMAATGLVLSILWLIAQIALIVAIAAGVGFLASKQNDPGCVAYRAVVESPAIADPGSFGSISTQLRDAAAKSEDADAKAAIAALADDFDALLAAVESGNVPPNLEADLTAHEEAANSACGYVTVDE
jgi:hypothetical protein